MFSETCLGCYYPLFHTDAVQGLQFLPCSLSELGVDLLTISAHKIYGPKGIGALVFTQEIRNEKLLAPIVTGGGQEFGLRSATENVPYIIGFGQAIELAEKVRIKEGKRIKQLRDYFWINLKKIFPRAELNGSLERRLPNNLNIYFPGSSAQDRCIELDLKGIAVSPGVACSARFAKPSYVITELGFSSDRASSSLRFTFGRPTTKQEIDKALKIIRC